MLGQRDLRALRDRVGCAAVAVHAPNGGDGRDRAVALRDELLDSRAGNVHRALDVHGQGRVQIAGEKIVDRPHGDIEHTCDIGQRVDLAVLFHTGRKRRLHSVIVGDVDDSRHDLAARCLNVCRDLAEVFLMHIRHDDACALVCEELGRLGANAGTGTGDETDFSIKSTHLFLLC